MIRIISILMFPLLFVSLMSCQFSDSSEFKIGEQFVKSTSGVVLIDTMKYELSSVLVDSFKTSSTTRLLIGSLQDKYSGIVKSTPYFELTSNTFTETATDLQYDSVVFKMKYDGYWVGDTTRLSVMHLYWLGQTIKLNDASYLSSQSKFRLKSSPFGEIRVYPTPANKETFYTRLDDGFGRELFAAMLDKNDTLTNATLFKEKYKGVAIVPEGGEPSSLIGVAMDSVSTAPSIRVYYHEKVSASEKTTKTYFELPYNTNGTHFINYLSDFSNSLLSGFKNDTGELTDSQIGGVMVSQSLSGVYAKVRIPGIREIPAFAPKVSFISAKLYLFPVAEDMEGYANLPDTLNVYLADHKNRVTGQLSMSSGGYVYAAKITSTDLDQNPYYMVDLTDFFDTKIAELAVTNQSLFFEPQGSSMYAQMQTVILGRSLNQSKTCRLEVYCYINHN